MSWLHEYVASSFIVVSFFDAPAGGFYVEKRRIIY
jgi:hypothetical protein